MDRLILVLVSLGKLVCSIITNAFHDSITESPRDSQYSYIHTLMQYLRDIMSKRNKRTVVRMVPNYPNQLAVLLY